MRRHNQLPILPPTKPLCSRADGAPPGEVALQRWQVGRRTGPSVWSAREGGWGGGLWGREDGQDRTDERRVWLYFGRVVIFRPPGLPFEKRVSERW
jgi:hypothetical protein